MTNLFLKYLGHVKYVQPHIEQPLLSWVLATNRINSRHHLYNLNVQNKSGHHIVLKETFTF
jgi:hypothetical protein